MTSYELDRAVASTAGDDGHRHLTLTADWNTPNGTANGGYVLAILARAVLDEARTSAPDHPDLLTVSVSYFKPPTPGPASVEVTTLRVGRRVSVHQAALQQGGRTVAHAVISLHDWDAAGTVEHLPHAAPAVPRPDDSSDLSPFIPTGAVPIVERYESRSPEVPGWLRGTRRSRPSSATSRPPPSSSRSTCADAPTVPGRCCTSRPATSSRATTTRTSSCGTSRVGSWRRAVSWPCCPEGAPARPRRRARDLRRPPRRR